MLLYDKLQQWNFRYWSLRTNFESVEDKSTLKCMFATSLCTLNTFQEKIAQKVTIDTFRCIQYICNLSEYSNTFQEIVAVKNSPDTGRISKCTAFKTRPTKMEVSPWTFGLSKSKSLWIIEYLGIIEFLWIIKHPFPLPFEMSFKILRGK